MMRRNNDGIPWGIMVIGAVAGLILGALYAWLIDPVEWVDISPNQLNADSQQEYVLLVAEAYMQDRDFNRATARLAVLELRDPGQTLTVYTDAALLRGADTREVQALNTLAETFGATTLASDIFSGTVESSEAVLPTSVVEQTETEVLPTATALVVMAATSTPMPPTATLEVAPERGLQLVERERLCGDDDPVGLIEVFVENSLGEGIPTVEVLVEWQGGRDTFFTGLKPDIDAGYADFETVADQVYSVTLVGLAEKVVGLSSEGCLTPLGRTSIPTYRLVFSAND